MVGKKFPGGLIITKIERDDHAAEVTLNNGALIRVTNSNQTNTLEHGPTKEAKAIAPPAPPPPKADKPKAPKFSKKTKTGKKPKPNHG